ncbi:hypothetical protein D9M73_214960 [compost metagenome]
MQGIGVGIAEHGDRAIAQRLGRALDAAGDFTAVGDEDFFESGHGLALWILRCLFGPLREQARSHRVCERHKSTVGAGLLAKLLNGPPRFAFLHEGHRSLDAFGSGHRFAEPFGSLIQ